MTTNDPIKADALREWGQCADVEVGDDGWSEWLHPISPYFMQCCDCGLIHELEFEITPITDGNKRFNPGETSRRVIIFRARRSDAIAMEDRAKLTQSSEAP